MKDLLFTQDAGKTIVDGKFHYPVLLRLELKKDQAIDLAKTMLSKYQQASSENEEFLFEIPLFGDIKDIKE